MLLHKLCAALSHGTAYARVRVVAALTSTSPHPTWAIWLLVVMVSVINAGVWWAWTTRVGKGVGLLFVLSVSTVGSAFLADLVAHALVEKLYYHGWLKWPEAQLSFLLDNFVNHAIGLFLATAVLYSMLRLVISKELTDKKLVIFLSLGIALSAVILLLLGIKLY